jgi:hypothetical protein
MGHAEEAPQENQNNANGQPSILKKESLTLHEMGEACSDRRQRVGRPKDAPQES